MMVWLIKTANTQENHKQTGFRKGKPCTEQIFWLQIILKTAVECKMPIVINSEAFCGLDKDSS